MPKVSIIMPVYNGQEFLEEAVNSIRNQTLSDIEILLINDQSTDKSGEICDRLSQEDNRIKVIHLLQNKGICGARNAGLKVAEGEYVAFCDNDDFFMDNLIEENYYIATNYQADMVKFGRKLIDVDSNGNVLRERSTPLTNASFFDDNNKYDHYFYLKSKGLLMNVWNGIYKRELIINEKLWFNEFMKYGSEDADFSYRFFKVCKNIIVNPEVYYVHYRRNEFSTSRKFNKNKLDSMILASREEAAIIAKMNQTDMVKSKRIIEINKLIMNMYTQQIFHSDNNMSQSEKIKYLKSIKSYSHLNYSLNKNVARTIAKLKVKHIPFSVAYSHNWMTAAYLILYMQNKMNNEKW